MYRRAFYPGRFQPFHLGHLQAVKYILSRSQEVVIGVTAAQFNYLKDNPFTAGERIEMIRLALEDLWSKVYVIPIENVPNNYEWVTHVESLTPSFDAVFTNNELVKMLFRKHGYQVEPIPWVRAEEFSGKHVRKVIAEEGEWENLVPERVARYIKEVEGDKRIRDLFKSEEIRLPMR
ncbi:MAG: nicotinamide-nucleotide adenylyltransferase [Thermoprotei archaeon]|nr:MAG: nicotinamide-nucleotide adenylyltransferase [Thermoprotei archaeon]RLF03407.1 MAG: nicotinamide-nucleotide adenylyltransferase [Thermoprotei archaeon]